MLSAIAATATSVGEPPAATMPAGWRTLDGPRVAVAESVGVVLDGRAALIGGFTDRLEATAAVQTRDPRLGWMPVGTALLEPRAGASAILLDDGTVLVIGGWSGRLPDDVTPLGTVERCDPWNPHRRREVPPPWPDRAERGLTGHAACELADGRVLLVHDRDGILFEPEGSTWSDPFPLAGVRRDGVLVPLLPRADGSQEILAIGGGLVAGDPAIESIVIEASSQVTTSAWPASSLPADLEHAATLAIDDRVIVAGGARQDSSVDRTWLIHPGKRQVVDGATLPLEGGATRATIARQGRRVVLVGGERRTNGRPVPLAHGVVLQADLTRHWALPSAPISAVRSVVLVDHSERGVELIGGYRFDASAARTDRTRVLDADIRLDLPRLLGED